MQERFSQGNQRGSFHSQGNQRGRSMQEHLSQGSQRDQSLHESESIRYGNEDSDLVSQPRSTFAQQSTGTSAVRVVSHLDSIPSSPNLLRGPRVLRINESRREDLYLTPCGPHLPDDKALYLCGAVHILHLLGAHLALCLMVVVYYILEIWLFSGVVCECRWSWEHWYCYIDGGDRDALCQTLPNFLRKFFGMVFILLEMMMLLRILSTLDRVVGPIQLLKEMKVKRNKGKLLEASIESLLGDHPELERMLHWRRSTIPRLDLMDWAAWNFRQTAGLFADHSDGLANIEQRKILTSLTRRLRFFFQALAPGQSGGSYSGHLQVLEEDLCQLRDRARAAPADLDLFSHRGAVEAIMQQKQAEMKKSNFMDISQIARLRTENAPKEALITVDDLRSLKILEDAPPMTYSMLCSASAIEIEMSVRPPSVPNLT
eukprot:gnl/MRDRNA2_/MRDRNA2_79420_c0_seq1.p1 gnl/MRDRNA2_/MRDRNA2_79420_c0~~gnl/MRDRNA2_/MRDRNA2_79420_c0_seq1.p1  ORF type:complete len:441 (-),score=63.34 gnl/MRDRNA2_/MRDRNA2_79420_c0_seq1:64-1353(-)